MVDALLPLAHAAELLDAEPYWMHWQVGDVPASCKRFLQRADMLSRTQPMANGLVQGVLALFMSDGKAIDKHG